MGDRHIERDFVEYMVEKLTAQGYWLALHVPMSDSAQLPGGTKFVDMALFLKEPGGWRVVALEFKRDLQQVGSAAGQASCLAERVRLFTSGG